jgi:ribose transport system substrate-binding protein
VAGNQYRVSTDRLPRHRYRIGYAALGGDSSFPGEVYSGLVAAAEEESIRLVTVDNRYDANIALKNADHLIAEKVDLVIEFQTDDAVAPAIASKYLQSKIPIIAIDVPHPGASYFGANNYEAGLIGGRHLGRWARKYWAGIVDEVVMVEIARAGSLPRARMVPEHCPTTQFDGDGQFKATLERMRKHLRESHAERVLVGAANDASALGALRAFEEAGRSLCCAVVGHNAEPEARREMREPRTRLIGSVAYFPERYGEGLIRLALDILARKPTPPAVFIKHQLITPDNVDHYYPNDRLMGVASA